METLKKNPSVRRRGKLARTFQKVCSLRTTSTKVSSSNNGIGICMLKSTNPNFNDEDDDGDEDGDSSVFDLKSTSSSKSGEINKLRERRRAVLEAVIAKIFASTTSIKAAYAELQIAQRPYDNDAIQAADTAVVEELRALSELKRSFLRNELNLSPQVAIMLAEIQEQQSLMRTYEITIRKLESEVMEKGLKIDSLNSSLVEASEFNKSIEMKLTTTSGSVSLFDEIEFSDLNLSKFVKILGFSLRSIRSFVKLMVKEMESAGWDLDAAASSAVRISSSSSSAVFARPSHRCFAFESFVAGKMLENFESPSFSDVKNPNRRDQFFNRFKNLRSVDPVQYLTRNPGSGFARFTVQKYLSVVHAKMECSFFGNLNQRKLVNSGGFPDSGFFATFCEMAKRIWLLHCLAFSMSENVTVFQIKRGCRFSQVYMESVKSGDDSVGENADCRVGFTVVPGFKIGENVVQSQVYLSPVTGLH